MIVVRPTITERRHMNTIIELLNLEDSDIYISEIKIDGTRKFITLETILLSTFAPNAILECTPEESNNEELTIQSFRIPMNVF